MQSCESVARSQRQAFHKLLRHAWLNSPFYRDLYSSTGIKYRALGEVTSSDLPLIDKKMLMDNFDRAVTDTRLRKRDLERWMYENRNPAASYLNEFVVFHSSGTSGRAGVFVYSQTERRFAGSIVASQLPPPANYGNGRTKAAFYIIAHGNRSAVSRAVRMPSSIYETLILSVLDSPDVVARKLNDFQPHQLHGYASSVHQLSRHALSGKLKISPQRILVGGDKLTTGMAMAIRRAWDVPIYDFYTASESSCIAVRESNDAAMNVLAELNLLEVPDAENRGTEDDRSGRLVLTNLYNHTLPIIRYSLGDEVMLGKPTDHAPGGTIKNLRGRAHDRLSVTLHDGCEEAIEAIVFDQLYVPGLERFQITSVRPDFVRIEYVATDNLDSTLRLEFQRILDSKGAARTKFEIRRVTRIAIDPQTGKSPLIRTQDAAILDWAQEAGGTSEQPRVAWGSRQSPSPVETKQPLRRVPNLPLEQQAIRAKCFHPSGEFEEFPREDLEKSIPDRFEKIVKRYPGRIAVRAGSQTVTYAELNAMANRVARLIVNDRGSDAEAVGLFFEKGIPLMAAMLGVLKSGKFFILLDPSVPIDRMLATLDNSEAHLILTGEDNFELTRLATMSGHQVMEFNSIDLGISTENLRMPILPSALAYIIYTSGSTGVPKGVVKNHQNQLHTVMLRTNANHICVEDRIALLPSGTANAVANTFLALLNGAALLPFDVNKEGVPSLTNWLSDQRVSICQIASPLFRRLCEILTGKEDFSALRILRMRSESVQQSDFILYQKHFPPSCLFLNGLSTTETSVLTEYLMDQRSIITGNEIPVGYEMEGTEVLLLDDDGKSVGFNLIGEIVVRSKYLSPGYWNNPDLTATKFKPDPYNREKRLYYTGDLGLMLPDGCLVHKGRKDFRVKIRGYGVELSEIEKALERHLAIKETIVLAPRITSGEARLVAYFTCHGEPAPSVSELRSYLKEKLPDFMIPSAFVRLATLPLTPNGKVNRLLLPEPGSSRPDLDTPFVAPRTLVEERLASIWAEVLNLEQVGIHDNFFDLGGHSLAVTRVVSHIIKQFQLEIPVQYFFQSPTVAALVTYVERAASGNRSASGLSVKPVSRDGKLPLSFSQERLWFLDQLEPGGYTYNLLAAYRLNGQVNITALEQSINEIIRRHEVLRTVFKSAGGQPEQIILPSMTVKIPLLDLRGLASEAARESAVRRLAKEEAQRPFDLSRGPLLRISLLQLADDEYLLFRAMHHLVIDGWSGGVLFRELAQFYEAFSNRQPLLLPDLPIQYADFATWQRQWLQGETLETHLSYWKKNLQNIPTLQLATDRSRPAIQTSHGAHQTFVLSETLSAGIKSLSHRHGVTLFTVLLAAFQTLLARYTGQTDIVIGSPIAGRNRGELEALIGFFLNMLALRVDLSGNPTFLDLLGRTRKVCLEALAHQDLPFEKLVEELHTKRDLSHHPLFQVTFGFRNTPKFSIQLAGLEAEEVEVDSGIARFDINLFMEEERDHLRGYVNYNTDLFNPDTIRRVIDHFKNLLESVVRNPGERIFNLSMLSETERHQLLVAWNDTERDYPTTKCIHHLFEEQVEKTPYATALVFQEQQLTYWELNQRANQLAHYLRKQGVGPEVLVGICLERSLEMVIALLGILKASGAYVPLDAEYPRERLAFILEDASVSVLLTHLKLLPQFPDLKAGVICIDKDWEEIAQESDGNPNNLATAGNLAYVIYTSGSAGQPKGVQIQHSSVVNLLSSMRRRPGLTSLDRLLAVTTLSFDIAGLELYLPLTVGGQTIVVTREVASDGGWLANKLSGAEATVMQATPSSWAMLLDNRWEGSSQLKILCGGEALPKKLADQLLCRSSSLWNMYGPTETTIWSANCQVSADWERVPLGRPIDNTQMYILDANFQPVPIGVPGEIYISGEGLARGYLKQPDLTAEKFLPNPFSKQAGKRLYKTGDIARYLPDGSIEFLGRMDSQVKIRGYRIELGEIEAVLSQQPAVLEAVVVAQNDALDKRLVAYVVHRPGADISANELRGFLKQKLPDYMIPSAFGVLDALPLTPNGKVDRKALPAPDHSPRELKESYQAPRTPAEEMLVEIWAEILKLERIGIHDNFFDLGGHSLLATQVISRVRTAFQTEVALRTLFEMPTIAEFANAIVTERAATLDDGALAGMFKEIEGRSDAEAELEIAERHN
jgi:amino acid adenylation domain-containing protein